MEIEVTPEMIEAGEPYLWAFNPDREPTSRQMVEQMFRAMWALRPSRSVRG